MIASRPTVGFMFPGQGAQFPGMAAGLYDVDGPFTEVMDRVFAHFSEHGSHIRRLWLSGEDTDDFDDVTVAQPLLLGINCATAASLMAAGVQPTVLIGHSVGEIAAAHIAGVVDLDTAMGWITRLIDWSRLVPAGGMLAVAASAQEVEPYLRAAVVVGAVNAARQVLLAGPEAELNLVHQELTKAGYMCFRARARQPFHSPAMWQVRVPPITITRDELSTPQRRMWTCYRAEVLDDDNARDPTFWARQPAEPVLFGPTLDRLLSTDGPLDLVEVGPGASLCGLARRTTDVARGASTASSTLPGTESSRNSAARTAIIERLGRLATELHAPVTSPRWGRHDPRLSGPHDR